MGKRTKIDFGKSTEVYSETFKKLKRQKFQKEYRKKNKKVLYEYAVRWKLWKLGRGEHPRVWFKKIKVEKEQKIIPKKVKAVKKGHCKYCDIIIKGVSDSSADACGRCLDEKGVATL